MRSGLRRILRRKDGSTWWLNAPTATRCRPPSQRTPPDVVVMDLRMKRVSGMEATRRLRALATDRHRAPPVLVSTTFRDEELLSEALRAGLRDSLKESSAEELIRAVRLCRGR